MKSLRQIISESDTNEYSESISNVMSKLADKKFIDQVKSSVGKSIGVNSSNFLDSRVPPKGQLFGRDGRYSSANLEFSIMIPSWVTFSVFCHNEVAYTIETNFAGGRRSYMQVERTGDEKKDIQAIEDAISKFISRLLNKSGKRKQ
jgi:hypothetical protein